MTWTLAAICIVLLLLLWGLQRKLRRVERFAVAQAMRIDRLETAVVRLEVAQEFPDRPGDAKEPVRDF